MSNSFFEGDNMEILCGVFSMFIASETEPEQETKTETEEFIMLTHLMTIDCKDGTKIEVSTTPEMNAKNEAIIDCPNHGKERIFLKDRDGKKLSKDLIMLRDFGISRCPKARIAHAQSVAESRKAASQEIVSVGEELERALREEAQSK